MMLISLFILPLVGALLCWAVGSNGKRPFLLPIFTLLHLGITLRVLADPPPPGKWLMLDPLGKIILLTESLLFFLCALYSVSYLRYRLERSNRVMCMGILACLAAASLAAMSRHLGLLWVAVEGTTLSMAPLVYFNRNARSIEATWKYLMVCSVGIALALLGTFFLAYSTMVAGRPPTLLLEELKLAAPALPQGWLNAAFVFLLVGFGTKAGLAPLHTWKPDAYGEAPGVVGALLAGGLVNCALLAIIRVCEVTTASGRGAFARDCLVVMGLVSMATAALFMTRQSDFKRMLAYSSVEHVGIISIGLGIGGGALFASMFHLLNNAVTKGVLFLASGNIHRAYGTKSTDNVRGALERLPLSGTLLLAGFFAVTASPPFATFPSEFGIVQEIFLQRRYAVGALFLAFLAVIFIGIAVTLLPVVMGESSHPPQETAFRDTFLTAAPPLLLLGVVLLLGLWLPEPLAEILRGAAALLEAKP